MSTLRFEALKQALNRVPVSVAPPAKKVSDYFGVNVFDKKAMKSSLPPSVYKRLMATIEKGEKLDASQADAISSAMKAWAIERGATHYTHWFQPLTGSTAEKHDAFFDLSSDGEVIEKFKGSALVQQEPDASSFPSGGLRNTFEARGYTAWDPTSPAFLIETGYGRTLCIPTIFVSYTGEALDHKTPLLKSADLLDKAATAACQFFDKDVKKVHTSLGIEQEFFVVDKALYYARPDLVLSGRTLFGHPPAKGQQLEDHYFGSIPTRVQLFMQDFEIEALKLGIPVHTRHNEVAPGQFECAPIFEEANLAIDHNLLLMDIMEKVAEKHNLTVLFHEKPFAGINGSGKHNNWSMVTNTGVNLLAPSSKAKENLQFLVFFINTMKAVYENADVLRASIASAGNDFRLGANEAPPAIMSVFVGKQLTDVLEELEHNATVKIEKGDNMYIKLGINKIPEILMDNTDRNRTSPFAFTGNKFEFRAVGSSANSAAAIMVLNTIVADQLFKFVQEVDTLVEKGEKREVAIVNILRDYIKTSKNIRFEGNGYSQEWVDEAKKRGLSNITNTPDAVNAYISAKSKALFSQHGVLSEIELHARHEIMLENYIRKVQIESRALGNLATNQVIPVAIAYQNTLIDNVKGLKEIGLDKEAKAMIERIKELSAHIASITEYVEAMVEARKEGNKLDTHERAHAYCHKIKPYFDKIRYHVDKLEITLPDSMWSIAKYRELLFVK